MHIHRLSAAKIKNAKPGRHADGGGLYLQVSEGRGGQLNRSWIFAYALPETIVSRNGRPRQRSREMGLGSIATLGLHEAREKAKQLRQLRLEGIDPIEHRSAQRAQKQAEAAGSTARNKTFEQVTFEHISAHGVAWRSQQHAGEWIGTLMRFAFPRIGKLPVAQIDVPQILEILQPIWTTKTETAHRLRGRIEAVLDYATAAKYRVAGVNPAAWSTLRHLLAKPEKIRKVVHLEALPYSEVGAFMAKLRAIESSAARALELAILTATRSGEVLNATWDEIGNDAETSLPIWQIPGSKTKSGRVHRVPLSTAASIVLERMKEVRRDDFIFPGRIDGERLGKNAMLQTIRALGLECTTHGFRSSFRDWAAERTSVAREIAELCLAHAVRDATVRAYQRSDLLEKRAKLMEMWAAYCSAPPASEVTASEVTPIRAVS
jgi:integrase